MTAISIFIPQKMSLCLHTIINPSQDHIRPMTWQAIHQTYLLRFSVINDQFDFTKDKMEQYNTKVTMLQYKKS